MATNEGVKGATTRLSEETQAARKAWLDYRIDLLASQFFSDCRYWQPSGSPLVVAMESLEERGIRSAVKSRYRLLEATLATPFSVSIPNASDNYCVFMGEYYRMGENVSKITPEFIQKISGAQNVDEYVALIRDNLVHSSTKTDTGLSFFESLGEVINNNRNNLDDAQRSLDFFLDKVAYYHFPSIEWDVAAARPIISYYNSEANFIRGIRTKTRAGRYMKMVCPDIPEHFLQYLIGGPWDQTPLPLKITDDPGEIERVYTNGPRSCMSYSADEYRSSMHPVRVYGNSPDLVLAYIERDERITARVLMRRDMTGHSTIYGDKTRMRQALLNAGMSKEVVDAAGGISIEGCHIRRVADDRYPGLSIVPYIDEWGLKEVVLGGKKMFKLVEQCDGDYEGLTTHGLTEDPEELYYCEYYEEEFLGEPYEVIVGFDRRGYRRVQTWSGRAVTNHAAWSGYYNYYVYDGLSTVDTGAGLMCTDDHDFAQMVLCLDRDIYVHVDNASVFGNPDNGEYISDTAARYYPDIYRVCPRSDTINRLDDMTDYHGEMVANWWIKREDPDFFTNNDDDDTSQKEAA